MTKRPIKKCGIMRVIGLMVIGMLIGGIIYHANASLLGRNPMPMPFGTGIAAVTSGSMEPALHKGDLIIVRRARAYKVGDIAVYISGSSLVVHRITGMKDGQWILKGDANNTADPLVAQSKVKGKVVFHIPLAGEILRGIRTLPGFLVLIVLAVLLIELPLRREKQRKRDEIEEIMAEIRRLRQKTEWEVTDEGMLTEPGRAENTEKRPEPDADATENPPGDA